MDDLQQVPVPKSPNLNFNDSQGASLWEELDIKEEYCNKEGIKFREQTLIDLIPIYVFIMLVIKFFIENIIPTLAISSIFIG